MTCGIYKLISNIDNKYYLGSSKNIEKRFERHINDLINQRHHNIFLQRFINLNGIDSITLEIILNCDGYSKSELHNVEQNYLNNLDECAFNLAKTACGGDLISNHPEYDRVIKTKCDAMQKYFNSLSDEEKKQKYGKNGEKNYMFGKTHKPEVCKNISDKLKQHYLENDNYRKGKTFKEYFGKEIADKMKNKLSELASQKFGEKNPFFGKSHSDETKKILSQKNKGRYCGNDNIPFTIDDIYYNSLGEASTILKIPVPTISWRLKSKNKKFKNYKYIEKHEPN